MKEMDTAPLPILNKIYLKNTNKDARATSLTLLTCHILLLLLLLLLLKQHVLLLLTFIFFPVMFLCCRVHSSQRKDGKVKENERKTEKSGRRQGILTWAFQCFSSPLKCRSIFLKSLLSFFRYLLFPV